MTNPHAHTVMVAAESALRVDGAIPSMGELAKRAGMSRATLYRIFPSRGALRAALEARGLDLAPQEAPRDRILDAVEALLKEQGLRATTIEAVSERAGVGAVTIYRTFGDRRGLFEAFVQERSPRQLAPQLLQTTDDDPAAALRVLARAALIFVGEHRALLPLILTPDPEARELFERLRELPGSTREALATFFGRQVAAGRLRGEPAALAAAFVGMVAAAALVPGPGDHPGVDAVADRVVSHFLYGCDATGHTPKATRP